MLGINKETTKAIKCFADDWVNYNQVNHDYMKLNRILKMKKNYLFGLLMTMLLTFILAPIPDYASKLFYALVSIGPYNLLMVALRIAKPSLMKKNNIWVTIIITTSSVIITLLVMSILIRCKGAEN